MSHSLTSSYVALPVAAFRSLTLPEQFHPATLSRGGRVVAALRISQDGLRIAYTCTIAGVSSDVLGYVAFDWTYPQYGGRRLWFQCPYCGRRRGVLYLGRRVACRECMELVYPCQMEGRLGRGWTLYHRWQARIGDGKPRGMHWKTFQLLKRKMIARELATLVPLAGWIQRQEARLEKQKEKTR